MTVTRDSPSMPTHLLWCLPPTFLRTPFLPFPSLPAAVADLSAPHVCRHVCHEQLVYEKVSPWLPGGFEVSIRERRGDGRAGEEGHEHELSWYA